MGTSKQELADDVGTLERFQLGPSIFFFLFSISSRVVLVQAGLAEGFRQHQTLGEKLSLGNDIASK